MPVLLPDCWFWALIGGLCTKYLPPAHSSAASSLPLSLFFWCSCCGGDCSLYVGADEILRVSTELFKGRIMKAAFLVCCWWIWIDISPPQLPLASISIWPPTLSLFHSPWKPRTSEQKSRHMARGHSSLGSQMLEAWWNAGHVKTDRKAMGLFIGVCWRV